MEPGCQVTWGAPGNAEAGTVVHAYEAAGEDFLVVFVRSMRWGKPQVRLVHVPASDVDPASVVPASTHQCHKVARWALAALGVRSGAFSSWELSVLGYAAAMASVGVERRPRREPVGREPARVASALWE